MGITVTDVGSEKKLAKHELKKHAATIHCSNSLSLLQRKVSNALLYHAYTELMTKEEHEITIKQLCHLISYSGNNHAVIKDALKGLLSTVIEWNVVNDTTGAEDWSASSILASVALRGPICLYAYSPRMKQLLHSPSMFGKINLFIQSRFKSSYGLALYENCIRYRGLPHTKWFDMELFRKLMGVPSGNYTVFRDFKRRVLDKSIDEVNTYSDLIVEPELLREGRQVVKVRFNLKERAKKIRLGTQLLEGEFAEMSNDPVDELKSKLISQYGLSLKQSEKAVKDYSIDYINEKISLIESSPNYQQGKVKNLAAYFLSALKNNYQLPKNSLEPLIKVRQRKKQEEFEIEELEKIASRIKDRYAAHREKHLEQILATLPERERLIDEFYVAAADSIDTLLKLQRRKYTRATLLRSPQMRALLRQYVLQHRPDIKERIPTMDEFLQELPDKQRRGWQKYSQTSKKGYNEIV